MKTKQAAKAKKKIYNVCTLYNCYITKVQFSNCHSNTGTNRKNCHLPIIMKILWQKNRAKDVRPTSWMSYSFVWFCWFHFVQNSFLFSFLLFIHFVHQWKNCFPVINRLAEFFSRFVFTFCFVFHSVYSGSQSIA